MRPPLFEAVFWARGDHHNGHSAHCWSILHLSPNDQGPAFLINKKALQKWWRHAEEWWQRTDSTQSPMDQQTMKTFLYFEKWNFFILKSPVNRLDLVSSDLQLTNQIKKKKGVKWSLRMRSKAKWNSTLKAALARIKIRLWVVSSWHSCTIPQQGRDWCSCCSWTFRVSVKSYKTQA